MSALPLALLPRAREKKQPLPNAENGCSFFAGSQPGRQARVAHAAAFPTLGPACWISSAAVSSYCSKFSANLPASHCACSS